MTPKEALEISKAVGEEIKRRIAKIVGTKDGSIKVGIGRNGTPTKLIDSVAEDAALKILKEYDVTVISEEAGIVGEGDIYIALDPLDGTFNATRGIPIYSVSICFSRSELLADTFLGYVLNLATEDEYWAAQASYKNGDRINVSKCDSLRCNAIVYSESSEKKFGKRIRTFGSAALEICWVADGSFDCFIDVRGEGMLRVYDVAAAIHIAKMAGGVVTDAKGWGVEERKFDMNERFKLIVANKNLHKKLLEMVE
jgi:myo-inositol-1(or 4)-monophosphatase